jgi:glyoxylase-like metal-dependent hydrolase (beta-lactamase superfamily II)
MPRWLRRTVWTLGVVAALAAIGYYPLVMHSPEPQATYALDLQRARALASSLPGDPPVEIRFEHVMTMTFAEAMVMAGAPWKKTPMTVYSYQVVYPQSTLIIDTAMARGQMKPDAIVGEFDEAAYRRMNTAMENASDIVVTHEHADHIGGIAAHPNLAFIFPKARLTAEQLGNKRGMAPITLPAEILQNYQPLKYEGMTALAPGVVLIRAPGHTPGSQIVYVRRADGREVLFLGDVSWRLVNIERIRERPLFMTLLIGEDRQQVLAQFRTLHDLREREPQIAQVPGHDRAAVQALAAQGVLVAGFR